MDPVCAARLLLLLLATATTATAQQVINYKPAITNQPLEGKITSSTFSLGMPICIFYPTNADGNDRVWLVVSTSKAFTSFVSSNFNILTRPAYQDFLTNSTYYLTLNTRADSFPCDNRTDIRVLRIGNNNNTCASDRSQPDCNGPLPPPGPYRVKFLVIDSTNVVKAETLWSDDITLKTVKNPAAIDIGLGRRSGGMIVITTILSILLALLLVLTIAGLVFGWSEICRVPTRSRTGFYPISTFGSMRISAYATHHINTSGMPANLRHT